MPKFLRKVWTTYTEINFWEVWWAKTKHPFPLVLTFYSFLSCRCHHWRACISNNHSSYYLDYFFSASDWRTTWVAHNSTVIRATINGTSESFKRMNGSIVPLNKTHNFYHVYDFFDFRPGPPDASNFQLPAGLYCAGLKGLNKTVPLVPGVFSLDFEAIWSRANTIVSNWQVSTGTLQYY